LGNERADGEYVVTCNARRSIWPVISECGILLQVFSSIECTCGGEMCGFGNDKNGTEPHISMSVYFCTVKSIEYRGVQNHSQYLQLSAM
jgi:hypothetical protein